MESKKRKNIFVQGPVPASFIAESIEAHSVKTAIGAHSIFLGQVRSDIVANKTVAAIDYTAYEAMALEQLHLIREAIFEKYPLTCLQVHHSLGTVRAGEISLFVFASAKRRKAAIDACEEIVERLKKELPIWGKELFEDASSQWKENA